MEREERLVEWRPVKGYEGRYEVSDTGVVRSLDFDRPYRGQKPRKHKGRVLKKYYNEHTGYFCVSLSDGHTSKRFYLHRILADAFVDKPKSDKRLCVDHKDGDKLNNEISNLEWVTHGENNRRAYQQGLKVGPLRKLSDKDVLYIRSTDKSCSQLAREFGMDIKSIWNARVGKTYKEVS